MSSNANPQRTYEIPSINKMMLYVREQVGVRAKRRRIFRRLLKRGQICPSLSEVQ